MAKVLKFPRQEPAPKVIQGYRMAGYTRKTLTKLDPMFIKDCLIKGYNSDIISGPGRKLINKIIDSIETIEVKVN